MDYQRAQYLVLYYFMIYVNDITEAAPQDSLLLYADDCTCLISDESLYNAINRANSILKDVSEWFINKLFNIIITKAVIFSRSSKIIKLAHKNYKYKKNQ